MQSALRCTNLWLITAELAVAVRKSLQSNGELDVTTANNVLDFELGKLGVETKFLDDAGVLARCQPRVVFRLRARDDHLSRRKDQGSSLGITNSHDDCSETLLKWTNVGTVRTLQSKCDTNLGVILRIPGVQRNGLQVESAIQIHSSNDVLKGWDNALYGGDVLLLESQRGRGGGNKSLSIRPDDCVCSGLGGGLRRWRGR